MSKTAIRASEYNKAYRATPKGAACFAWNRLSSRSQAKYGFSQCYSNVEVRMTREEFLMWAIPAYAQWMATRPNETASVDRIDPEKHYEPGNLRLISVQENRRRARHFVADVAPAGTKWCPDCKAFKPCDEFYSGARGVCNRQGLSAYCKPCHNVRQKRYQDKRRTS